SARECWPRRPSRRASRAAGRGSLGAAFVSEAIIIKGLSFLAPNMNNSAAFRLEKVAEADFPTEFGHFRIYGFRGGSGDRLEEAVVLRMGEVEGGPSLVRIHSLCLTGDVFHSLRCDCRV